MLCARNPQVESHILIQHTHVCGTTVIAVDDHQHSRLLGTQWDPLIKITLLAKMTLGLLHYHALKERTAHAKQTFKDHYGIIHR